MLKSLQKKFSNFISRLNSRERFLLSSLLLLCVVAVCYQTIYKNIYQKNTLLVEKFNEAKKASYFINTNIDELLEAKSFFEQQNNLKFDSERRKLKINELINQVRLNDTLKLYLHKEERTELKVSTREAAPIFRLVYLMLNSKLNVSSFAIEKVNENNYEGLFYIK